MSKQAIIAIAAVVTLSGSGSAQAGVEGSWNISGVMKVRILQQGAPVRDLVFPTQSDYVFNGNHTFAKGAGAVTGNWLAGFGFGAGTFSVALNKASLKTSVEAALNKRGTVFYNLKLGAAKITGKEVENGILGDDAWSYRYVTSVAGKLVRVVEKIAVIYQGQKVGANVGDWGYGGASSVAGAGLNGSSFGVTLTSDSFGSVDTLVNANVGYTLVNGSTGAICVSKDDGTQDCANGGVNIQPADTAAPPIDSTADFGCAAGPDGVVICPDKN